MAHGAVLPAPRRPDHRAMEGEGAMIGSIEASDIVGPDFI
ncbi:hypothetical protein EMEDMD4_340010 [Sinorhizobium medicae]|uniref:Uncharacterized protein n=1 Tax=Sinorhizobium medicae TaxID=110321 RepID=A0A508WX87_9HYPH|nr:hypothetical protein EMEDMD4_340010 [Sinorhizobium medicae]